MSTTTNKITTGGYSYDANGNMDNDGVNTLTYDAENRVVSSSGGGGSADYVSDAAGLRVKKCVSDCTNPTTTTVYVSSGTKVIAEYVNGSLDKEYIYSGSALVATHDAGTLKYHHSDHLSMRVTTNTSGGLIAEQGHYPFGESWYQGSGGTKIQFTSYERDSESGNDYAIFRTHISRLGRFNRPDPRPDPIAGSIADPQSLNRFAYVRNRRWCALGVHQPAPAVHRLHRRALPTSASTVQGTVPGVPPSTAAYFERPERRRNNASGRFCPLPDCERPSPISGTSQARQV